MRNRWMVVGAVALAVAGAGCKKSTVPNTGCVAPCYRPLTTAAAPLANLALAYQARGVAAATQYATLLDSARFSFRYYDPQSSTPTIPQYWGASTDSSCTRGLLTDPAVSRIELTFPLADTAAALASTVPGDPAGTMKIAIRGVVLKVQKGDVLYQTTGGASFYIAQTAGAWKIIRWEDETAPPANQPVFAAAVLPTTWGSIKAQYTR